VRPLNVAIVGCGRMGRERARCVQSLHHDLIFVVDTDVDRAMELAREYGAKVIANVETCLNVGVDALFLCTPPGLRGSVADACVNYRVPFLVEKPIGISAAQSSALADQVRRSELVHAVGYMNRYRRSVMFAKELVRGSRVIGIAAHWVCSRYKVPWVDDEQLSGGPYNDQAIHLVDLSRFLIGEVVEVQATFQTAERAAWLLRFESGAIATIFYSCEAKAKDIQLEAFTEQGTLRLTGWNFRLTSNTIDETYPDDLVEDAFLIETEAFLESVRSGHTDRLRCGMQDALATQRVIDATRQSHSLGRSVSVARPAGEQSCDGINGQRIMEGEFE
jgi:myo-inositol 2-dehydrogenase / D-chiro-inositol 1-dehydrogenase